MGAKSTGGVRCGVPPTVVRACHLWPLRWQGAMRSPCSQNRPRDTSPVLHVKPNSSVANERRVVNGSRVRSLRIKLDLGTGMSMGGFPL